MNVYVEPELDAGSGRRGTDAEADRRGERIRFRVQHLDGLADAHGPLNADRRRLVERDGDAVLARERGLDHFLLHLAVQRDRDLVGVVGLPDVDQRVLLGELPERNTEMLCVVGVERHHG